MSKDLRDVITHCLASLIMTVILLMLPHPLGIAFALILFWYGRELGQQVARDETGQGILYWWKPTRWGDQAWLEFMAPSVVIIAVLSYVLVSIT
ncbi:hypothetical protein [Nitrosomonas communis]|uniref:Uncharacterized protein n=1 Tax=Nitrosomonas communis TaxID=44574 RepID=A0A1I4WZ10_9PROT|nr:hypothetical protein [Nitrosomonas communis]SFN18961.1 hypothetical protein SAMN05421863_11279 [Nitrosomonas communis]